MKPKFLFLAILISFFYSSSAQNLQILQSFDEFNISKKTIVEAEKAFSLIKNAPIPQNTCKEKANNCENRAAFSNFVLKQLGFEPINFWIFKESLISESDFGNLVFDTKTSECKKLFWGYHVASGVKLNMENGTEFFVFDPWTQTKLVKLSEWSLGFLNNDKNRTAFVFPVKDNYYYFPIDEKGKLLTTKDDWYKFLDTDSNQMYCGLCGITPNKKCSKNRFKNNIQKKKLEIVKYLSENNISQFP